jgi:hypothetical protein
MSEDKPNEKKSIAQLNAEQMHAEWKRVAPRVTNQLPMLVKECLQQISDHLGMHNTLYVELTKDVVRLELDLARLEEVNTVIARRR